MENFKPFERRNTTETPVNDNESLGSPEKILAKLEVDLRGSFETSQRNGGAIESPEKSFKVDEWKTNLQDLLAAKENEALCARVIERTAVAKDSPNTFECQLYRLAIEADEIRRKREPAFFKIVA